MFDFKIRKTYFVIFFVVIEMLSAIYWNDDFRQKLDVYYEQKLNEQHMAYSATQNTFKMMADIYYNQIINTPEIIELLQESNTQDEVKKAEIRNSLQQKLGTIYKDMSTQGLKQLSFYLPDNEALYRFHSPNTFDDATGDKRFSVQKSNSTNRSVQGFEEGADFNGFRFVYPIHAADHSKIGVLDMGVGFNSIRENIMKARKINYAFIVRKDAIGAINYKFSNTHFISSDIHAHYLYDTHIYNNGLRIYADNVDSKIRAKLNEILRVVIYSEMNTRKAFAETIPHKSQFYTVCFLPLKNIEGEKTAYLIGYSTDNHFEILRADFYLRVIGTTLFALLILGLVYFENRRIRYIRLQNEEMHLTSSELRKLNNTKEKFLSFVADDLRNPFHFLKGYSMALLEDLDELPKERIHYYLMLINEAAENGNHLIENLLEWSKIQKSKNFFNPDFYYISDLVDAIVQEYVQAAEAKKISFYSEISKKESNLVYVDAENIRSLLRNLISNAIKFTPDGGIVVISAKNLPKQLEVTVEDNGIGIKPQIVKILFSTNREFDEEANEGSSHLGLILSRELVERNGGQLRIESQLGKGTRAIFAVPIDRPNKLFKTKVKTKTKKKIQLRKPMKLTDIK